MQHCLATVLSDNLPFFNFAVNFLSKLIMKLQQNPGKKSTKDTKPPETPVDAAEEERKLYLTQIKYLEDQVQSYQLKRDALKKQNQELSLKCCYLDQDTRDASEYLYYAYAELKKDKEEMMEMLKNEQLAEQQSAEAYELLISQEREKMQKRIDDLTFEINNTAAQQKKMKAELDYRIPRLSRLRRVEEQLVILNEEHAAALIKVEEYKQSLMKKMRDKLRQAFELNIKNTVLERKAQYKENIEKAKLMLRTLEDVKQEKRLVKKKMDDLYLEEEKDMIALSKSTQKISELQKDKEVLIGKIKRLQNAINASERHHQALLEKNKTLRENLTLAYEQQRQNAHRQVELAVQLQEEERRIGKLERVMKKAAADLRTVLKDSDKVSCAKQKMEEVLKALERARPKKSKATEQSYLEERAAREEPSSSELDPLFLLAKFRLGDSGFIRRPTWDTTAATTSADAHFAKLPPIKRDPGSPKSFDEADPAFRHPQEHFRHYLDKFLDPQ